VCKHDPNLREQVVHKLGVERNAQVAKHLKSEVQAVRASTQHKVSSLRNKQHNELEELRNRY
jgi:hypothetical protein